MLKLSSQKTSEVLETTKLVFLFSKKSPPTYPAKFQINPNTYTYISNYAFVLKHRLWLRLTELQSKFSISEIFLCYVFSGLFLIR